MGNLRGDFDWERATPLLGRLLELPPGEWQGFLATALPEEEDLAAALYKMAMLERDSLFLEPPSDPASPAGATGGAGDRVGPYRLIRLLGQGGQGTVWLAEREGDFAQRVAVKLLHPGFASREVLGRFRRERRVLAGLEHPGVARLVDGGSLEGSGGARPWLAMEYVEGIPIDDYCRKHGFGVRERLELFIQVVDAVEFAHQRLVVHRDLKPSNVLVRADGRPVLLDFGIAKVLETETDEFLTRTEATPLTPRYASPEQIAGRSVTTQSDVYSLGVLLYELLVGRSPYGETTSAVDLLRAICETDPPRPSAVARELQRGGGGGGRDTELERALARDLDWIVMTALRKDTARRYPSAARLADDLRRHLVGRPVSAGPDTWRYRSSRFVHRNRIAVISAGLAFVALLAASIVSTISAVHAIESARQERAMRSTTEETLRYLATVLTSPSPELGLGRDARMVDVLELARADADAILDPRAALSVRLLMGSSLAGLGEFQSASRELRLAITHAEALSDSEPELIMAWNHLGGVHLATDSPRAALGAYEHALTILDSVPESRPISGRGPLAVAIDQNPANLRLRLRENIATAHSGLGHWDEALAGYRSVLADQEREGAPAGDRHYIARMNLGGTLMALGRFEEAEHELRRAHRAYTEVVGPDGFFAHVLTDRLSRALLYLGRSDEALRLVTAQVGKTRAALGDHHTWTISMRTVHAWALLETGDVRAALSVAEEVREEEDRQLSLSYSVARIYEIARAILGEPEQAALALNAIAMVMERSVPRGDISRGLVRRDQARALVLAGRTQAAREAYTTAIRYLLEFRDGDHIEVRRTRAELAALEEPAGVAPPPDAMVVENLQNALIQFSLAGAHAEQQQYSESLAVIELVQSWLDRQEQPPAELQALVRFSRGASLFQKGHYEPGRLDMEAAHAAFAEIEGEAGELTLGSASGLALIWTVTGRAEHALVSMERLEREAVVHDLSADPLIWQLAYGRAWALEELARWDELEALTAQLGERPNLADELGVLLTLERFRAAVDLGRGRPEPACERLVAALARAEEELEYSDWERGLLHSLYGDALASEGRPDAAADQYARAAAAFERLGGPEHPERLRMIERLDAESH